MATAPNKEKSNKEVERIEAVIDAKIKAAPEATVFNIPASDFLEKVPGSDATLPLAESTKRELVRRYQGEGWAIAKFDQAIDAAGVSNVFTLEA